MANMARNTLRVLAASLCLLAGIASAQDDEPVEADPPDRAARLSYIEGEVSLQPAGEDQWAPALLNRPLTSGDRLLTTQGSRAEVQVGPAAVRLAGDTGFSFVDVGDDTIRMRVTSGIVNVRVRWLEQNEHIGVETPNIDLTLLRPGNYRVEVNAASDTTVVKISEGEAEGHSAGRKVVVRNQQVATFRGTGSPGTQFATLGAPDEFDAWSLERDRREERVASSQTGEYVSPDVTGYEDLEENGTWSSEPEYGYVWTPSRVIAGWAPYQYGRWVWISPWGWTWVDDAPWGYAPFHYGRWAYVSHRWCWVPGPRRVRAVYAPALVGWVGSGHVGWFPLGPREVYVPARRFSHRYVERVNLTNTQITDRGQITHAWQNRGRNHSYRNRAVPGAVTTVSRTAFTSSGRVGDHRVRIDEREHGRLRAAGVPPRIEPARESRLGGRPRAVDSSSSERFTRRFADRVAESREVQSNRPTHRPAPQHGGGVSSPKTPPRQQYSEAARERGDHQRVRGQHDRGQHDRGQRDRGNHEPRRTERVQSSPRVDDNATPRAARPTEGRSHRAERAAQARQQKRRD